MSLPSSGAISINAVCTELPDGTGIVVPDSSVSINSTYASY